MRFCHAGDGLKNWAPSVERFAAQPVDATWSMVIAAVGSDPGQAPALKQWAKNYWEAIHPFDLGGAYPNFMMDDEGEARIKATYGDNYQRLGKLKKKYDPGNLFRVNQNIRPMA